MNEEEIFLAALEQVSPTERAAYLDTACADNPGLRERVEALLRSHADPDSFLDVPAVERQAAGGAALTRTHEPADEGGERAQTGEWASSDEQPRASPASHEDVLPSLTPSRVPGSLGRLDHYEVLEVVGRGGMGVVLKARDTKLQRIVAIKLLAPQLATSGTARKRFIREAQAAAAVRDEHVVGIHAVSEDASVPYLVMEFIAGMTLAQRVKQEGPLEIKEILRIGLQAAKGLAAAHAQGLIHRDVTPGNILLENGVQRVKLTDFGLARARDDSSLTQQGIIAGTPLYMSPEQARGEPLDARSDLFSLGSVLYTLCTGQAAFPAAGTLAILRRICDDVPRPVREVNPEIPDWLAGIVDRLMAKNPAERFQSAAELAEVLGQHLAHLQQSGLMPLPKSPSAAGALPRPEVRGSRRRIVVLAACVGLVGVAASLAIVAGVRPGWLFRPHGEHSQAQRTETEKERPVIPSSEEKNQKERPSEKRTVPIADDVRVLTVSQKAEDGGRFRTIHDALDAVEPGMTIRVLDDAVYAEHLAINQPHRQRGVVLEAAGKASLRRLPGRSEVVRLRDVPDFRLRGFRFQIEPERYFQVHISGSCPGVVLEGLDMTAEHKGFGILLTDLPLGSQEAPVVIRSCILRNLTRGILVRGSPENPNLPILCSNVVIRENALIGCGQPMELRGAIQRVQVVGNRILESYHTAIDLFDLLPGTSDVLLANNTLMKNKAALRVWDDHAKGKDFLKCQNIRVHNNLVLQCQLEADMIFANHPRGDFLHGSAGEVQLLLKSPEWHFSHNWREQAPVKPKTQYARMWIYGSRDHLQDTIPVESREPSRPGFLRPAKDSPLATGGAGPADPALPSFVGAIPPEGVEPWSWEKTWKMLVHPGTGGNGAAPSGR